MKRSNLTDDFLFYRDTAEMLDNLSDEEAGKVFFAAISKFLDGTDTVFENENQQKCYNKLLKDNDLK